MKLIKSTGVTSLRMAFKHPTWHHRYNTQHSVLTPDVAQCLQRPKDFNIHHRVHIKKG